MRLLGSEPLPRLSWTSVNTEREELKKPPRRPPGGLTQAQLRTAERYALRYGLALPAPTSATARQASLALIYANMRNAKVAGPSVAGDALADAKKAARTP